MIEIASDGFGCLKIPVPATITLAPAALHISMFLTLIPPSISISSCGNFLRRTVHY